MKVLVVAGARPNFMKIAPIMRAAQMNDQVMAQIVHTGQHYDYEMSQAFFEDLELPKPVYYLNAGSGSHAQQTARIMTAFEELCEQNRPDLVLVVGDVNSTLACAIVAKKMLIKVAHVEAGLRSFDLTMPEEINRMVTDAITDYFFVTEKSAVKNLVREGKPKDRIHYVGHVMIDNLFHQMKRMDGDVGSIYAIRDLKDQNPGYAFLTLHRPSNVDSKEIFAEIASALNIIAAERTIFFPVHPRTKKMMAEHGIPLSERVIQMPPLSFREALFLWKDARIVLTDSGGLQEETTALKIPCLTLRENTERPITVEIGSNVIAGTQRETILRAYREMLERDARTFRVPPKWDGKSSERIWSALLKSLEVVQSPFLKLQK